MSDPQPPAVIASGQTVVGEVAGAKVTQFAQERVLGRWRWLQPGVLVAVLAAWGIVVFAIDSAGGSTDLVAASAAVGLVVLFMAQAGARRQVRRVAGRSWRARGLPATYPMSFAVEDDALVMTAAVSTTRWRWEGVSELAPFGRGIGGKGYWIIPAGGLFFYLPRRFFPTPEAETVFLAAMLARMTPAARARSVEARKLTAFE